MEYGVKKDCDTCIHFIKVRQWQDGRKGLCRVTDMNIINMKNGNCKYYKPKRYNRKDAEAQGRNLNYEANIKKRCFELCE
jgi:hypothetical protein